MEDEDAFSLPLPLAFVSILTGLVGDEIEAKAKAR